MSKERKIKSAAFVLGTAAIIGISGQEVLADEVEEATESEVQETEDTSVQQEQEQEAVSTYTFYDSDNSTVLSTQKVIEGDSLVSPSNPEKEGFVFQGWSTSANDSTVSLNPFSTLTVGLQVDGAYYSYYPVFLEKLNVTFIHTDGQVVQIKSGQTGDQITTSDVTFNLDLDEGITGWYLDKGLTQKVDVITLNGKNVTLYPKVEKGHYVTYYYDDQATYIAPQFVKAGDITVAPSNPTRPGYTFMGWSTLKDRSQNDFVFGTTLNENVTAYAIWQAENVKYTVIYWKQSINDDKNALDSEKTYDYAQSVEMTGLTGSTATNPSIKSYKNFILNRMDENVVINGDGTTVVNVYYDRALITIRFDIRASYTRTTEKHSVIPIQFGVNSNGNHVRLTYSKNGFPFFGYSWKMNGNSYTGNRYIRNGGTELYTLTGLYGQTLAQNGYEWPSEHKWIEVYTGKELTFLDAFIIEDVDDDADEPYSLLLEVYNDTSIYPIRHYKQHLDGTYSYNSPTNMTRESGGTWHFTNKYYGFTIDSYYTGGRVSDYASWKSTSVNQSVHYSSNLYVRYRRNTYNFAYYNNNGISRTERLLYEADLSSLANYVPNRPSELNSDYQFMGWYKDAQCTQLFDFDDTMPYNDVMIYAKWQLPSHTVIIHSDMDGSGTTTTQSVEYLDTVDRSLMPVIENSSTWATRSSDGIYTLFNLDTRITSDVELYPFYFSDTTYSVTYDLDGGTGSVTDPLTYMDSTSAVVALSNGATKNGCPFLYWELDGQHYYPGMSVAVTGDLVLKAVYGELVEPTSLTYNANGGIGSDYVLSNILNNDTITTLDSLLTGFSRPGYRFIGWNTKADGTGTFYAPGDLIFLNNRQINILYAMWEAVPEEEPETPVVHNEDVPYVEQTVVNGVPTSVGTNELLYTITLVGSIGVVGTILKKRKLS